MSDFFFEFYNERLRFVQKYCLDRIESVILLCCYVEALGRYRFGPIGNRERFTRLLLEKSDNAEIWSLVSIPMYRKTLQSSHSDIFLFLSSLISTDTIMLSNLDYNPDLSIEELLEKARGEGITSLDLIKQKAYEHRYVDILWKYYRSSAVHETSIFNKNKAPNLAEKHSPGYNYNNDSQELVIFFPKVFIFESVVSCLNNLKQEYQDGIWEPSKYVEF